MWTYHIAFSSLEGAAPARKANLMYSLPVENNFTPTRRYEGFEQNHAVVARGQASDSQHDRGGGRYRERQQEAPHDEAVLSDQAIKYQKAVAEAAAKPSAGPLARWGPGWWQLWKI